MSIFTPQNQTRLTNVSVVRLRLEGKRFELACYKNKVVEYRNKTATDLDQVLQSWHVFSDVSKGKVANGQDLFKCFGTRDLRAIIPRILNKGEIQVGAKEREHQCEALRKDIAMIVSRKLVDKTTGRPLPPSMIEKHLTTLHISIKPNQSAKQQALEVLKRLENDPTLNVVRSQMKAMVTCPLAYQDAALDVLTKTVVVSRNTRDNDLIIECLVDVHDFGSLEDEISLATSGQGSVQSVNTSQLPQ